MGVAVQGKEGADLEETCGDIERNGQVSPLFQVVPDLPIVVAVIHDEQIAALLLHHPPFRSDRENRPTTLCMQYPRTTGPPKGGHRCDVAEIIELYTQNSRK